MVTQTIRVNLNQKELETIQAVQNDTLREIAFVFYLTDSEDEEPLNPDGYTVKFNMLKPDNNFVMSTFTDGIIKLSFNMTAVTGTGYYCIMLMDGDDVIYSGNGKIVINDHVIGTENIDSVSEADGYVFPNDFYTKDTPLAVLDDTTTSTTSTWSSEKIAEEIASIPGVDIIDDNVTSAEKTWSSSKISTEVEAAAASEIDDNTTATDSTWSSEKIAEEISEVTPTITKEVTGNPIEFTDGADAPLVKCVTQITGYQSGTGTPSPDNVRPITAYTEGEIEVRGKNLFDVTEYPLTDGGYIMAYTGGYVQTSGFSCTIGYIPISKYAGQTVTLNHRPFGYNPGIAFYSSSEAYISGINNAGETAGEKWTFTIPNNAKYMRFTVSTDYKNEIQIELGSTVTTYEPYKGVTHTTTYPSAIYRGSEDVVNGSVRAEKLKISVSSGIVLLGRYGTDNANIFYYDVNIQMLPYSNATYPASNRPLSNRYNAITTNSDTDMKNGEFRTRFDTTPMRLYIRDDRYEDATEFNAAIANDPIEFVILLYTPTTASVTPTNLPIKSLNGYNHIESSTGEMEIEYLVDDYQPIIDCIPAGPIYSMNEQITGTWTDGRPVYTRIVPVNATWQNIGTTSRQSFVYMQDWAKQIDIITDLFIIGKDTYYGYSFSAASNLDRGYGTIEACWNDPFGGAFTTMPVECVRMSYVKTASVSRNLQRISDVNEVKELQDPVLEERREEEYEDEVHNKEMFEPGTYDTYRE